MGHSLEVQARIGRAAFDLRYGELRITVPGALSLVLAAVAIGRLLGDLLLSPITAGRGWRVADVESARTRTVLVVITGNVPCAIE